MFYQSVSCPNMTGAALQLYKVLTRFLGAKNVAALIQLMMLYSWKLAFCCTFAFGWNPRCIFYFVVSFSDMAWAPLPLYKGLTHFIGAKDVEVLSPIDCASQLKACFLLYMFFQITSQCSFYLLVTLSLTL